MDEETLSGEGDVYVKKTREAIGRFAYVIHRHRDRGAWHTDATVALDAVTAQRCWNDGTTLVIRTREGRYQDFSVTGVRGDRVEVTATRGLRDQI